MIKRTDGNPLTLEIITKIERALNKEHQGRAWVDGVYGFVNVKDSETAKSVHEKVIKKLYAVTWLRATEM
jgi:hypothetical protein